MTERFTGIRRQYLSDGWNGNNVFAPLEYDSKLFIPISDNENAESKSGCYVKMYDSRSGWDSVSKVPIWTNDLILGKNAKNIPKLIEFNDCINAFTEGNGYYIRNISGEWTHNDYPDGGYAAYDAVATSASELYTGTSGKFPEDLKIWKVDTNDEWTNIKTFEHGTTGRPTAWAFGDDGNNIYVGIGGYDRGRGGGSTVNDGIWKYDGTVWTQESDIKAQSFAYAFNSMFAGGNDGKIYRRSSDGIWSVRYDTFQESVISFELIQYANLIAGTENGACLFKSRDGNNWVIIENFDAVGSAYTGMYHKKAVIVYHYSEDIIHAQYRYRFFL